MQVLLGSLRKSCALFRCSSRIEREREREREGELAKDLRRTRDGEGEGGKEARSDVEFTDGKLGNELHLRALKVAGTLPRRKGEGRAKCEEGAEFL